MATIRTPITYYGGKGNLATWVAGHFPPHRTYIEPFGGAASVLLAKRPAGDLEIYNDRYAEVVNFFRVLRDNRHELYRRLRLTPFAFDEYRLAQVRTDDDPIEAARRFFIRCNVGFGSRGAYDDVGFSRPNTRDRDKTRNYMAEFLNKAESLLEVSERLRRVIIENNDVHFILGQYEGPETLTYCDPPYVMESRREKTAGYMHEYTDEDHTRLLVALSECKGMVALSGYATPLYSELLPGWVCHSRGAMDMQRHMKVECLWLNPALERAQSQPTLFRVGGEVPEGAEVVA